MRDVRRSGRWFPERGCILEHQICRFAKMILRDRCSTSYDLAFPQTMAGVGHWKRILQRCISHSTRSMFIRDVRRSGRSQTEWKNCKTHWYEAVSSAFNFPLLKEVSQSCFVFDVVNLKHWRSLAEFFRFWLCLKLTRIEEVSQNCCIFPHIFVWGSCFWLGTPALPPSSSASPSASSHLLTHNLSTHNLRTHNLLTHNLLTHNSASSRLLTHTTCPHTHNLRTHNLLTHNLLTHTHNLHTTCPHTTNAHTHNLLTHNLLTHDSHTQLVHTQLTHIQRAHTQLVLTQLTHTQLIHTTCPHTTSHTTSSHTHNSLTHNLVTHNFLTYSLLTHNLSTHNLLTHNLALGDMNFTLCQAWHVATSLRILRGTYDHLWHWAGFGGALGSQLTPWTPRLFVWQAWHLATSTCILCGRRGRCAFCVAGVALMARGWLWWRAWVGRRGTWRHRPPWHLAASTFTLCGRRGGYGTGLALVAFVTHNSFTHNFVAHFFHATLSHISFTHNFGTHFFHTQLCHTHNSFTHNFVTHNSFTHATLSHTTLSHTTLSHTTLSHTPLSHITFYTQLCRIQVVAHTQHFYIHKLTHLLRTVMSNFVVECILRAKALQLYLTGMGRWKDPRKSRGHHRHSQCKMKGVWSWPFPFNKAKSFPPWQIAKTVQKLKWTLEIQNWRHAGSRLSRLPFREMLKNDAGTQSWSGSVSPRTDSVFVGQCLSVVHCPPAVKIDDETVA